MPRTHKKKPGSRNYKNYTEETLLKAVNECKKVPIKDVAQVYNIPIRTLRNKVNGLHSKTVGGQTVLTPELEEAVMAHVLKCADYGMPLSPNDIKFMVKGMLDKMKLNVPKFKSNLPGPDWIKAFLSRHEDQLCQRNCQNIKRSRAEVDPDQINKYFSNLQRTLAGVPPENILNYDETNLLDEPGQKKCVFRRGIKYPERVINYSKGNISLMFSGTASGQLLPPYVIYKAEHMWDSWRENGPAGSRYGRSKNGWMDSHNFLEWFMTIVVPWARRREGVKALIGDNLSSHISHQVIEKCEELNIAFILLPPNATDKLQPLDVGFFAPLKKEWRKLLENYRQKHPSSTSLDKSLFPMMLNNLITALGMRSSKNLISGFRACGIVPLNPQAALKRFPSKSHQQAGQQGAEKVSEAVLEYLHQFKYSPSGTGGNATTKRKRTKVAVSPGKSVSVTRAPTSASASLPVPIDDDISPSNQTSTSAPHEDSSSTSASQELVEGASTSGGSTDQSAPATGSPSYEQHEASSTDSESSFLDDSDNDGEWLPEARKRPRKNLFG